MTASGPRVERIIRLCDNLDCWNLVSRIPWEMRNNNKHTYCCKDCYIEWLKDHNPMDRQEVQLKQLVAMQSKSNRERASKLHKGRKRSKEAAAKTGAKMKGRKITWKDKLSKANLGKKHSEETKQKISRANKGQNCGEDHPNWQGGISFEPYCPKFNNDLRARIRAFFDYTCVLCGKSQKENGRALCCHHVEYNKQACCDGLPIQFASLCHSCHAKTSNSGNRQDWMDMIHTIIREIYNNKSYYTREEWQEITNRT